MATFDFQAVDFAATDGVRRQRLEDDLAKAKVDERLLRAGVGSREQQQREVSTSRSQRCPDPAPACAYSANFPSAARTSEAPE